MATTDNSPQITVHAHGQSFVLDRLSEAEREAFDQLLATTSQMWLSAADGPHCAAKASIVEQWLNSAPPKRKFLQDAVSVHIELSKRNTSEKTDDVYDAVTEAAGLDCHEYLKWANALGSLVVDKEREPFKNLSIGRALDCLMRADWLDHNLDYRIFDHYLNALDRYKYSPNLYLGSVENCPLALELIGCGLELEDPHYSGKDSFDRRFAMHYLGITSMLDPTEILSLRYTPLDAGAPMQSFLFAQLGNVWRLTGEGYDISDMRENLFVDKEKSSGPWGITNANLVMKISNAGYPDGLYMLKAPKLSRMADPNGDDGPCEVPSRGLTSDSEPWTLAEITNMGHRDLTLNLDVTTKRVIDIRPLSTTEVDIAGAGIKNDWSEDNPPIGVHLVIQPDGHIGV